MDKLQQIVGDYDEFLRDILREIVEAGFDLADFSQIDHLCYRTSSIENYQAKKKEAMTIGKLLGETQVNNRPISVFRLHEPIRHENWRIDALELPAPKPDVPTKEGLEHIEFVLFDDKDDFLRKHADKQFDLKSADRGINPEIAFKLPSYSVKFHLLALPTVVYLEHKLGITDVRDGR